MRYEQQIKHLISKQFYQSDSLGSALEKRGCQSEYVIPHCYPLQFTWLKENAPAIYWRYQLSRPLLSFESRVLGVKNPLQDWTEKAVLEQVKRSKPDVIYIYSGVWLSRETLKEMKTMCKQLVLQWSCPIVDEWSDFAFGEFDAILTSADSLISRFENKHGKPVFLQQAFDTRFLEKIRLSDKKEDVVFAGSFHLQHHAMRIRMISGIAEKYSLSIYCPDPGNNAAFDIIKKHRKNFVAGEKLIEVFANARISLHIPGDDFADSAGAKRLFEVTGAGSMLLALEQKGIGKYFEPGKEIVLFRDTADCLDKLGYYLSHEEERAAIARAGQERTFRDHTFEVRARELLEILKY